MRHTPEVSSAEAVEFGTREKALRINLDSLRYGTFAEIGAGQEVARWFFRVGAAAGSISKSISAYDMAVSDAIYPGTPAADARRYSGVLRFRGHRFGPELSGHQRVPRLDGRQVSGPSAR